MGEAFDKGLYVGWVSMGIGLALGAFTFPELYKIFHVENPLLVLLLFSMNCGIYAVLSSLILRWVLKLKPSEGGEE